MDFGGGESTTNILYVDDEPSLLDVCKVYLEKKGDFNVDTLPSAAKALEILETTDYDAIISDYQMPGMDGIEFLKELRARGDNTPVIIFTGKGREEVVIEALNSGADFYIQKGGDPRSQFAELTHKINQAVRRQNAENALSLSLEYLDNIFNSVKAGILIIDAESHEIIDVNPAAVRMIEAPKEEIIGKICHKYLCSFEEERSSSSSSGEFAGNSERTLITSGGREIPVIRHVNKLELNGRSCLLETFIDNTEQKEAQLKLKNANEELFASYEQISAAEEELQNNMKKIILQQEEISEKNEIYYQFFKTTIDAVFITTPEGKWLDCNEALAETCGYGTREEVFSVPVSYFYANPEDRIELLKMVEEQGFVKEKNIKFRKKDGTVFDGLITMVPLKNSVGTIRSFIGTVHDITLRKAIQNELESKNIKLELSQNRLKRLFQTMNEGVALHRMIYDDGGNPVNYEIIATNPSYERIIGLSQEQIKGRLATQVYGTENPPYIDIYANVAETGIPEVFETYYPPLGKHFRVSAYCPENGQFVTIFDDITGRIENENALQENERRYRNIFESFEDLYIQTDKYGFLTVISPSVYHILGWQPEELIGKQAIDVYFDPQGREVFKTDIEKEGNVRDYELLLKKKDGTNIPMSLSASWVKNADGSFGGTKGALRDISKRKKAEEALNEANRKLSILNTTTRHDINNQITALYMTIDSMSKGDLDFKTASYLKTAEKIVDHIHEQIEFTREYTDIGVELPRWYDVNRMIDSVKNQFDNYLCEVFVDIEPIEIYADPLVEKVFYNLFDNIVRHGEDADKVWFSVRESDGSLILSCEDNGQGVDLEMKSDLFKRGHGKNTGYGLYLIKEILSITNISIRETGEPGTGARFEIIIPNDSYRYIN